MSAYTDLQSELNKTLTTKNEIKSILQENGSDVNDETLFSEYPTKIANLVQQGSFDMNKIQYDTVNARNIEETNTLYQAETAGIVQYSLSMSGAFNAYIQCKANKGDATAISRQGGYIAGDASLNLTLFIPKGCWYSCNYTIQNIGEDKQNSLNEIVLMRFIPLKSE